jgi:hypothetical protein
MTATSFSKAGPTPEAPRDSGLRGARREDFAWRGAGVERFEVFRFVLRGAMDRSEKKRETNIPL